MAGDTYTVREVASLLGVSGKRVRQLVAEGRLVPVPDVVPMSFPAEVVHAERDRRRVEAPRPGPAPTPRPMELSAEEVLALARDVAQSVARDTVRLALESAEPYRVEAQAARDRTEQALRDALMEAEARARQAEAQAEELRRALEIAQESVTAETTAPVAPALPVPVSNVPRRKWWGGKASA